MHGSLDDTQLVCYSQFSVAPPLAKYFTSSLKSWVKNTKATQGQLMHRVGRD